jgi:hypothetical protein
MITRNWHANCLMSHTDDCPANIRTPEGIHVKTEQRQHPRYGISEAEFHVFSHGIQITGRLVNVSNGGLAFEFASEQGQTNNCLTVDIMGPGPDRFYLPAIACRRVYDISVLAEGRNFTGAETRLRGVQFIGLTNDQIQKLTNLIDRFGFELPTIP